MENEDRPDVTAMALNGMRSSANMFNKLHAAAESEEAHRVALAGAEVVAEVVATAVEVAKVVEAIVAKDEGDGVVPTGPTPNPEKKWEVW